MSALTVNETLLIAIAHQQASRLAEAEVLYRQILAAQPHNPDALHLLGVIASQTGQHSAAAELIARAIAAQGDAAHYHSSLGEVYSALGRVHEALSCYEQAATLRPDLAETHYNLGLAQQNQGQMAEAIFSYERALAIRPDIAEAHNNMGNILASQDRLAEAAASFQRALEIRPDYAEAHYNLGKAWKDQGQMDKAISSYQRALAIRPDFAEAHNNLGSIFKNREQWDLAVESFRLAVKIRPDYADAFSNLGSALKDQGRLAEAIAACEQALALRPDHAETHNDRGSALTKLGRLDEAVASFQRALALRPDFADACNNMGVARMEQDRLDEAIASFTRALALAPDFSEAHNNLGMALKDQGHLALALESFRRAVALAPNSLFAHSNLVYHLYFHHQHDAAMILEEHRQWNRQHGQTRQQFQQPFTNTPNPDRRLKVGYVSPDLRGHPVGRFLLPLLQNHDHKHYEILCYADVLHPDALTKSLQACADLWRPTRGDSEEQLTERIRKDGIDILVDLTLHMGNNRLSVFARRPAPVQVTYLAYAGTSGLEAIDYRLTDPYLDPPDANDDYSETSVRLPETYWCYQAPEQAPSAVAPSPCLSARAVTFGCLNNFSKVNAGVVALWARLMQAVPNSRLLIHTYMGGHREQLQEYLAGEGISPERVNFVGLRPSVEYYAQYSQIDIALDTFPYAGGTTTCDALWMGVPVVSLVGKTAVGRGGLSILSNIGLPELVAHSEDEYVKIAKDLAADLPRLTALRATLRDRMLHSPLMDAPRFARNIEDAYRAMWRTWCEKQISDTHEP